MSRMNASWSNPNHLSDALPEFLRSPMTVAIGASILAHGIFFLGLPVVANSSNKADLQPIKLDQTALTDREKADLPPSGTVQDALKPTPVLPSTTPGLSDGSIFSPKYDLDQPSSTWIPPLNSGTDNSATVDLLIKQRNEVQNQLAAEKARNLALATKEAEKKEAEKKEAEKKEAEKKEAEKQAAINRQNNPTTPPNSPQLPKVTPQPTTPTQATPTQGNPQTTPSPKPVAVAMLNPYNVREAQKIPNGMNFNPEDTKSVDLNGVNAQWYQSKVMNNPLFISDNINTIALRTKEVITLKAYHATDTLKDYDPKKPILIGVIVDPNGKPLIDLPSDSIGVVQGSGYPELNDVAIREVRDRLRRNVQFQKSTNGKYRIYTIPVVFVP
jgi:hypothetical protein